MKIIYLVLGVLVCMLVFVYVTCPNLQLQNSCVPFFMKEDSSFFKQNPVDVIKKLTDSHSMTILCTSGLTNRIITMLSFYYICRLYNIKLNVIWIKDGACNGYFQDYFEDIENVTIHTEKIGSSIFFTGQCQFKYIVKFFGISYNHALLLDMLRFIRLKRYMKDELQYFVNVHNITDRIGVHVRRTDFTGNFIGKLINGSNEDKEFYDFIGNEKCFIATDNRATQLVYKKHFNDRIVWFRNIPYTTKLRKTSIKNAIIDLYLLSFCKKIKGTMNSRFSEFSKNLKKARVNQL